LFQIPYRRWAPLDYAGGVLWVLTFALAGYALGLAGVDFDDTKRVVSIIEISVFAIFVIAVVAAYMRFNKQQAGGGGDPPSQRSAAAIGVPVNDE
jgi:membrane protein DedA with SNARE-associated domain